MGEDDRIDYVNYSVGGCYVCLDNIGGIDLDSMGGVDRNALTLNRFERAFANYVGSHIFPGYDVVGQDGRQFFFIS